MVRASSVEGALLFDIVVMREGMRGRRSWAGGCWLMDLLLCVFLDRGCLVLRISGAIWGFGEVGSLRDESA